MAKTFKKQRNENKPKHKYKRKANMDFSALRDAEAYERYEYNEDLLSSELEIDEHKEFR